MGIACSTHVKTRNEYRILMGKPQGKRLLGDLDVGGRIILKWILERWDCLVWIELMWLRIGINRGFL
jgi:hypothetical protein